MDDQRKLAVAGDPAAALDERSPFAQAAEAECLQPRETTEREAVLQLRATSTSAGFSDDLANGGSRDR
jgi:hypothetical protein